MEAVLGMPEDVRDCGSDAPLAGVVAEPCGISAGNGGKALEGGLVGAPTSTPPARKPRGKRVRTPSSLTLAPITGMLDLRGGRERPDKANFGSSPWDAPVLVGVGLRSSGARGI